MCTPGMHHRFAVGAASRKLAAHGRLHAFRDEQVETPQLRHRINRTSAGKGLSPRTALFSRHVPCRQWKAFGGFHDAGGWMRQMPKSAYIGSLLSSNSHPNALADSRATDHFAARTANVIRSQ